jgi:hypothetical protein
MMWWTMLRAASWMPVVSASSWMTGAPGHGLFHVEHRRQQLVGHVNAPHRLFGDGRCVGGHGGHAVAHVAHLGVEADLVVGRRVGVRLAAAGVLDAGNVAAVDDGAHAGDGSRLAVVDLHDTGVGVGAGQQPA